ncbi:retrotransposon hot spot (RHS) protein, partial [Trypanosoma conorhini]
MEEAPAGPQWALYSTVEEVLRLEEVDAPEQITLNDFIRRYVDPNFVLEGRNVMMGVVIQEPVDCISDERLLGRILNSPEYQRLEDAHNLMRQGVYSLGQWKDFHQKDIVAVITRSKLNAALEVAEVLERAWRVKEIARRPLPEGFYDSVLKARWSHVLGFPEGDGEEEVAVRMEVKAGQAPAQSWEYKMQGTTLRPVNDAGQFTAPRPRLMVLTSEKGWPCLLREGTAMKDCYVNREADRVWRIVQGDLNGAF